MRALATLVDLMLAVPVWLLAIVSTVGAFGFGAGFLAEKGYRPGLALGGVAAGVLAVVGWVLVAVLTLYQWYLLATRGQTIGKRVTSIRITDLEGQPAGLIRALVLRAFVFGMVISFVSGLLTAVIPFAALVLALLDVGFAFGPDRRCLHDYFAGTQVRWVTRFEVHVGRVVAAGALGLAMLGGGVFLLLRPATTAIAPLVAAPVPQPTAPAAPPTIPSVPAAAPAPAAPPSPAVKDLGEPAPAPERGVWKFIDKEGLEHFVNDPADVPAGAHATRVE